MNTLPAEILDGIFSLLHQSDQVECMTVCRKWESTIKSTCLLRTIHITSRKQIEKLKKLLEQEPSRGERVQRLVLDTMLSWSFDLGSFLKLIPNPRVAFMPTTNITASMVSSWYNCFGFYEINGYHITYELLHSGIYPYLESIIVYSFDFDASMAVFIGALVNAPALKRLKMNYFNMTLDDFELLHKNVPQLCLLDLEPSSLLEPSGLPMTEIIPTTSLTSLRICLHRIDNTVHAVNLLHYISQKYTSLFQLEIQIADGVEEETMRVVYQDGLVPLLRTYGPSLRTLSTFLTASPQDLFNVLENVSYHLQSLKIKIISCDWPGSSLESKVQLQYLQTLKLTGVSFTASFDWLKDYTVLKELDLTFSYRSRTREDCYTMTINKLLEACPETVESILLSNVRLIYELSNIPLLPFVKKLQIRCSNMAIGLDGFISKVLPNLSFLSFDYCELAYKHLSFPSLDLDCLNITDIYKLEKNQLLVTTLQNDKHYLYEKNRRSDYEMALEHVFPRSDNTIYPPTKLVRGGLESGQRPFISVVCANVKNVTY